MSKDRGICGMKVMKKVQIYTDGSCSGNPGPGGWGAVLVFDGTEKELSGGTIETTNNRMELTAVIQALAVLKEPCEVILTSDSKYVTDSINKGWLYNWLNKGWKNFKGQPTPNTDLWMQLIPLLVKHKVSFHWIKSHAGHPMNERCDQLATQQTKRYKKQRAPLAKKG